MSSLVHPSYRLASHVYACKTDRHVIFLDLTRDRYLGIDALDAHALRHRIDGLPVCNVRSLSADDAAATTTASGDEQSTEVFHQMLGDGMLKFRTGDDRAVEPASIDRPEMALIDGYVDISAKIEFRDLMSFLTASMTAATLMRYRSLENIIARVRRHRCAVERAAFDIDSARTRVAIFNRLRPFIYTARDACLFSSLAVREYLARYRLFPQLVFGVTSSPFKAHCWLQHKGVVVNDAPEYVREYTPILVV